MFSRRIGYPLLALALAAALWFRLNRTDAPRDDLHRRPAPIGRDGAGAAPPGSAAASARVLSGPGAADASEYPLAASLNAPDSTIARDLDALSQILDAWRTNFPRDGNPVGENNEITAALTGDNPLQLVLIPKHHPAVNARGELCDRWGTPFRFHQLSGDHMEIRSAGPDGKFGTADDAQWSPGS